jgi:hypothetical protein
MSCRGCAPLERPVLRERLEGWAEARQVEVHTTDAPFLEVRDTHSHRQFRTVGSTSSQ